MSNVPVRSSRQLVIIPSYNTGAKLEETVSAALRFWEPVWVIIDGSTDGSGEQLKAQEAMPDRLRIITLPENQGNDHHQRREPDEPGPHPGAGIRFGFPLDPQGIERWFL